MKLIEKKELKTYYDASAKSQCLKKLYKLKQPDETKVLGFVICDDCRNMFNYYSTTRNRHLNTHVENCKTVENQSTLHEHFKSENQIEISPADKGHILKF